MKKEERDLNFLSTQTDINNETNPFFWVNDNYILTANKKT